MLNTLTERIKSHYRTCLAISLLAIIFGASLRYNYLLFHTLVELFSIIVAFAVFTVTWNSRKMLDNSYLFFQGITYLFIGGLDLMHTITFKGMQIILSDTYFSNQFWVATRFLEAAALIVGFYYLVGKRRLNADLAFIAYIVITLSIILSILVWKTFPPCFVDGIGQTQFKINAEYTIIAVLFLSIYLLLKYRSKFETSIFRFLLLSISFTVLSEFCFTLYVSNYSASNAVGHIAKLIAFFFTYKAVVEKGFIKPTTLIFKNLTDSEKKYRTLSENLPVLIFRFDRDTNCIYANKAVQRLLNAAPMFYAEKTVDGLGLPQTFAACIKDLLQEATNTKEEKEMNYSFDAGRHYSLKVIPEYTSELHDFTYLIISYDITELKVNEKTLQDLNSTKDKFFSIIAHDLKTPFTSILAFSDLLQKNAVKFSPVKIEQMALSIRKSAQNAYSLLENLLSWSRLQTGALLPKPELIDARHLMKENAELFSSLSMLKEISIEFSEESSGQVYSDRQMLNTVLRNLISNAVKFSHTNSKIILKAVPDHDQVLFSIQDFGTGIESQYIDRLFKLESSFTTTGTKNEKGSGLGLILTKEFVEKSHGKIWLESIPGLGTTFFFSIPAAEAA